MPEPWYQTRFRKYESMIDTSGQLRSWSNPVWHEKYREFFLRRPEVPICDQSCRVVASTVELPDVLNLIRYNLPQPPQEVINDLCDRAMSRFVNAVEPKVLLLNFIIELIETLKGFAEHAKEHWEEVKRIYDTYIRWYNVLIKKGLRDADAWYLAYQFAVKPFIGDLKKLFCIYENAIKRTRWLLKNQDKPVRVLFRKEECWTPDNFHIDVNPYSYAFGPWSPEHPPWVDGPNPTVEDLDGQYRLTPTVWKLDFCAQATVVYRLPPARFSEDGSGIGLVLSSMLATDRIGSAIWEAIPFSFVVDWFTDLGKQLATWVDGTTKNFPDGVILETSHSFKLTSIWDVQFYGPCTGVEDVGRVVYKKYQRSAGLPQDGNFLHLTNGFNAYHNTLGLALVTQRLIKKSRRRKILPEYTDPG